MMFSPLKLAVTPALMVTALGITACSEGGTQDDGSGGPISSTATSAPSASAAPAVPSSGTARKSESGQENNLDIQVTIDNQTFQATLTDSAAARDLMAQLPVTLDMRDHGGVEKTGPLPSPLSLDGQPEGADPEVGDVGYYAPGNDLVLYYGDQSYFPGIVVLGHLAGDAAERIAELDGPVTAVIEAR